MPGCCASCSATTGTRRDERARLPAAAGPGAGGGGRPAAGGAAGAAPGGLAADRDHRRGRRLPPRPAALALLAASALARVPFLAALGDYSQPVLRSGDPVPALAGSAAALLLTAVAVAVAVVIRARARALAESYRRAARMAPGGRVVVVPGHALEAYALPGSPGRIVVSRRLLAALDDRGRAAPL